MILKISGNICQTMVVKIQKCQDFMYNTSRDIIFYFSAVSIEDPVLGNSENLNRSFNIVKELGTLV